MSTKFPGQGWVEALIQILNNDERYAQVARKWEGDLLFVIQPEPASAQPAEAGPAHVYLDLWHGKCRAGRFYAAGEDELPKAAFTLTANLDQFSAVLDGRLDPMQAMLTRRLQVSGNMGYILRNVPVVLDFVRCCRKVAETG